MTADAPTDRGRGPVIVLLHGVGVGPESFASVAELLEDRHPVVALERPAGPGGAALDLPDQADLLARSLDDLGAPVHSRGEGWSVAGVAITGAVDAAGTGAATGAGAGAPAACCSSRSSRRLSLASSSSTRWRNASSVDVDCARAWMDAAATRPATIAASHAGRRERMDGSPDFPKRPSDGSVGSLQQVVLLYASGGPAGQAGIAPGSISAAALLQRSARAPCARSA